MGLYRGPAGERREHRAALSPCCSGAGTEVTWRLCCADPKDKMAKLLSLEATQDHAIVELGQSTVV